MLTIYAMPKPFLGHIGVIQRNAIKSWTLLRPECEVILFGDEEGTAEVAKELGVKHYPDIKRNSFGTPLLNDLFDQAEKMASGNFLCFVNADIILMGDFLNALERVMRRKNLFLMVGRRWNVDIDEPLKFEEEWEEGLRLHVVKNGHQVNASSIDYFVFPKKFWDSMPPFAIGRPRYDNWMIFYAREKGRAVVDASPMVMAIHQNHDYSHVPKGQNNTWEGPEAEINKDLYGRDKPFYTLSDANLVLTKAWLRPNINIPSIKHILQKMIHR